MKQYNIAIFSFLFLMSVSCSDRQNKTSAEESIEVEIEKEIRPGYNTWEYKTSIDEMDDIQVQFAHLRSENSKDLGFVDESKMDIIIRHREDNGDQVFLNVDNGTFDVERRSEETTVRVRFDKGDPIAFKARTLIGEDKSSVGILKSSRFIELVQNSDTLLIEASFFRKPNQVFKFYTKEPLKWKQ